MEYIVTSWILQKISPDDPGSVTVDFDTFNIGLVEDGEFKAIYTCYELPDAQFLVSALKWYSTFIKEQSAISIPVSTIDITRKVTKKVRK